MNYTADWTTHKAGNWLNWLAKFKGREAKGLEIGVWEGQSSNWFVDNILVHPASILYCVDPFSGGDSVPVYEGNSLYNIWKDNTKANSQKIRDYRGPSDHWLPILLERGEQFDFIYVDGLHTAEAVLRDCIASFELCEVGGILILDDYLYALERPEDQRPQVAIDAFMDCYSKELRLLHKDFQVALERIA